MKLDGITGSFPLLTQNAVPADDWTYFLQLPEQYRHFLLSHNGGSVDEFRYTFLTGVPFRTEAVDNPSREDSPVEFFGIPTANESAGYPDDLLQRAVDYEAENFLPSNLLAIATCVQSSLVCISTGGPDLGAIYYWDWYWRYPWCEWFFTARLEEARKRLPDCKTILQDEAHPKYQETVDALNYATVVKLADSLNEWLNNCVDKRGE